MPLIAINPHIVDGLPLWARAGYFSLVAVICAMIPAVHLWRWWRGEDR